MEKHGDWMTRRHTNLTISEDLKRDFQSLYNGSLSRFVEEKMLGYVNSMRLRWWITCPECKQKSHIRAVLNNGGCCPKGDCNAVIVEEIVEKDLVNHVKNCAKLGHVKISKKNPK